MIIRPTTRIIIQSSAMELLKTIPQDKLTVKQIADNCGISVRTFYNNFTDRNDAINSVWEDAMTPFLFHPIDQWYTYQLNYIIQNADVFQNILRYTGQNNFSEIYYAMERKKLMMHMNPAVRESDETYEQFLIGVEYMIRGNLAVVNAWINNPNLAMDIQKKNDAFGGLWKRFEKTWPPIVTDNLDMEPVNIEQSKQ